MHLERSLNTQQRTHGGEPSDIDWRLKRVLLWVNVVFLYLLRNSWIKRKVQRRFSFPGGQKRWMWKLLDNLLFKGPFIALIIFFFFGDSMGELMFERVSKEKKDRKQRKEIKDQGQESNISWIPDLPLTQRNRNRNHSRDLESIHMSHLWLGPKRNTGREKIGQA